MGAAIEFGFFIIQALLSAVFWVVVASAIVSWLVAFDVVNSRSRAAQQIIRFLGAVTRPLLAPLSFIPPLGGVDVRAIILLILIAGVQRYLIPAAELAVLRAVV